MDCGEGAEGPEGPEEPEPRPAEGLSDTDWIEVEQQADGGETALYYWDIVADRTQLEHPPTVQPRWRLFCADDEFAATDVRNGSAHLIEDVLAFRRQTRDECL